MPKLMIIYHSQEFGNTEKMAEAIAEGAKKAGVIDCKLVNTNKTRVDFNEYSQCRAVVLGSPDYFSYVAGGLKMFFDDWYINAKGSNDKLKNKPYGLFYSHGGGGKVVTSLESLAKHLGPKAAETVGSQGTPTKETLEQCRRLGEEMGKKAL
jgi:flavorubredoxin